MRELGLLLAVGRRGVRRHVQADVEIRRLEVLLDPIGAREVHVGVGHAAKLDPAGVVQPRKAGKIPVRPRDQDLLHGYSSSPGRVAYERITRQSPSTT